MTQKDEILQTSYSDILAIFPEYADQFNAKEMFEIASGASHGSGAPLQVVGQNLSMPGNAPQTTIEGLTNCQVAIAAVVVEAIFFVLTLMGIFIRCRQELLRYVRRLPPSTLNGFQQYIRAISQAQSVFDKAKAVAAFVGSIYKAGGFKLLYRAIRDVTTDPWEAYLIGLQIAAQITFWLATGMVKFIAEIVAAGVALGLLVKHCVEANHVCKG